MTKKSMNGCLLYMPVVRRSTTRAAKALLRWTQVLVQKLDLEGMSSQGRHAPTNGRFVEIHQNMITITNTLK